MKRTHDEEYMIHNTLHNTNIYASLDRLPIIQNGLTHLG